jgi:uncharacterized protein (TIGR02271 family)
MGSASDEYSEPVGSREDVTISAVQEQLSVGVERTETGAVRLRKLVHEDVQEVPITLRTEAVVVERVSVNQPVPAEYGPRQEGETLIVPVFEYVPVTEMRLMLKEEVRITKAAAEVDAVHQASVRREELIVERRDGASGEWFPEDGSVGSTAATAEKEPR